MFITTSPHRLQPYSFHDEETIKRTLKYKCRVFYCKNSKYFYRTLIFVITQTIWLSHNSKPTDKTVKSHRKGCGLFFGKNPLRKKHQSAIRKLHNDLKIE